MYKSNNVTPITNTAFCSENRVFEIDMIEQGRCTIKLFFNKVVGFPNTKKNPKKMPKHFLMFYYKIWGNFLGGKPDKSVGK